MEERRTFKERLTPPSPIPESISEHLNRLGVHWQIDHDIIHGDVVKIRLGELKRAQGGRI